MDAVGSTRRPVDLASRTAAGVGAVALTLVSCGGSGDSGAAPFVADVVTAEECIVRVHGKGGNGAQSTVTDGVAELWPSGNAEGWDGRQWLYSTDQDVDAALTVLTDAVDPAGCERIVLNGFSNGAAFVGKLLCTGETLDGRLVGALIDDPVPDLGVVDCEPDPSVEVALYWTGELAESAPGGTDCSRLDWTCEGGEVTDIEVYAASIGVPVMPSPFSNHEWFLDAPEPAAWLATD